MCMIAAAREPEMTDKRGVPKDHIYRLQKGNSLPLAFTSIQDLSRSTTSCTNDANPFSLPVAASSTISIQLLANQHHQHELYHAKKLPFEETNAHQLLTNIPRQPPANYDKGQSSPRGQNTPINFNLTLSSATNSYPDTPIRCETPLKSGMPHVIRRSQSAHNKPTVYVPPLQRQGSSISNSGKPTSEIDEFRQDLQDRICIRNTWEEETYKDSGIVSVLDDSQDSASVTSSTSYSSREENDTTCSVDARPNICQRVAIACQDNVAVIVQVICDHESTQDHVKLHRLTAQIASICLHYCKRIESDKRPIQDIDITKLKLEDGSRVEEHIDTLSTELSDNIIITTAQSRRSTDNLFIGTFVNEPVYNEGCATVGKSAVVLSLVKLNKIAPVREFSDQLCHHIAAIKPESMGHPARAKPDPAPNRQVSSHVAGGGRHLLAQHFLYDPTITVTEAARRSFVQVKDFVLYG